MGSWSVQNIGAGSDDPSDSGGHALHRMEMGGETIQADEGLRAR
jgi:hypothetical protein